MRPDHCCLLTLVRVYISLLSLKILSIYLYILQAPGIHVILKLLWLITFKYIVVWCMHLLESFQWKQSVYNYSPVKICQQLASLLPTFSYLLLTSHLHFTGSSLTGMGRWRLLATTAMLPTTSKHFDRAVIIITSM